MYEESALTGFRKIDSTVSGYWDTCDDESGISELVCSLGVNLRFANFVRFCRK